MLNTMSELFLVRHAQASFGEDDYDRLSTLGHKQARWLGEYFQDRKVHFDQVICGNMLRHRETLENISAGMKRAFSNQTVHSQWNEFDFKSLTEAYLCDHPDEAPDLSAPREAFFLVLHKALHAWADNRLAKNVPESWIEFEQRVHEALQVSTQQVKKGGKILVVSSGGAISMAIRQVLMAPPTAMIQLNIQTRNSSFSHLYFNHKEFQLSGFNHTPHLDHPDRSHALTYY